jgi:hypothetical protein
MAYNWTDHTVGLPPVTETDTVQKFVIGTRCKAFDPTYGEAEFIYLPGVASTIVGSVVAFDTKAATTTLAVVATRGPVAVAMSINVAGQWGWYQISGSAVVKTAAAVVAGTPAYSTATAGQVDDAVTAGSLIDGMVFKTADGTPAAGFAIVQMEGASLSGAA